MKLSFMVIKLRIANSVVKERERERERKVKGKKKERKRERRNELIPGCFPHRVLKF